MVLIRSGYDDLTVDDRRHCTSIRGWLPVACTHATITSVPIRCGFCQGCRNTKRAVYVRRIMDGCNQYSEFWSPAFLTLTSLPHHTWPQIMRAWQYMVRYIREVHGRKLRYVGVKEEGKLHGMKHLHFIIPDWEWVDADDLRLRWTAFLAPTLLFETNAEGKPKTLRVNVTRVVPGRDWTANYMLKQVVARIGTYISKGYQDRGDAEGCAKRRISFSSGWPRPAKQVYTLLADKWSHAPRAESPRMLLSGVVVDMMTYTDNKCACWGDLQPLVYMKDEIQGSVIGITPGHETLVGPPLPP